MYFTESHLCISGDLAYQICHRSLQAYFSEMGQTESILLLFSKLNITYVVGIFIKAPTQFFDLFPFSQTYSAVGDDIVF